MRKIKFRAWDGEEMIYDVGIVDGRACDFDDDDVWFWHEQPKAIMQFTGLLDKNGKNIWEGDIILYEHPYAGTWREVVVYDTQKGAFSPLYKFHQSFEVIGNIHQNPKLMKTERERQ